MIATIRSEIQLRDVIISLFQNKGYREKLANELCSYFGVGNVQLTHSGRAALYYLLKVLPQKKVYLPAYNCWAVAEAVLHAGKEPEYIDIRLDDFNMDIAKLGDVLEPDSIIIATHQFGIPCDIDAFLKLAEERSCFLIEDNAAAFGAEIGGKKTGSFARASILSFDYAKTLVSGKGGAILFNDEKLYCKVRENYRNEVAPAGIWIPLKCLLVALAYSYATHKYLYPLTYALVKKARGSYRAVKKCNLSHNASYLFDYDDIRAKLAYRNLKRLDRIIARRTAITTSFLSDPALVETLRLPSWPERAKAVPIKLPVRPQTGRDAFYASCREKGVDLAYLFPYHYLKNQDEVSNSRTAAEQALALPVYSVLSDRDLARLKIALAGRTEEPQQLATTYVERRKLSIFSLCYYWLDTPGYLATRESIALLRSHEELPESEYHLKFSYKTFLINLDRTKDEIYASFDASGARYKIRKALRSGVKIEQAQTMSEKMRFYDFYQAFVEDPKRKNKILVLQKNELNSLDIFYALSAEGEFLGGIGLLPSPDGQILLYKYAATYHRFCENELLLWQAIQHAKDSGFRFFDMSWMTLTDDKNSDMYRLYQFKRKFGGQLVDFYSYVKFNGILRILSKPFDLALKHIFDDDINKFALFLKRIKIFK